MGYSIAPTFRSEMDVVILATGARETWTHGRWDGRATTSRVDQSVEAFEASTLPGGCNEHLGVILVRQMRVIRQSTGAVVATSSAQPMFKVA